MHGARSDPARLSGICPPGWRGGAGSARGYCRPAGRRDHRQFAFDARVAATASSARAGRSPPTAVAHLGTGSAGQVRRRAADPALISSAWARSNRGRTICCCSICGGAMAERRGADAVPRLIVIGRRGWENEQVVDMLERCPALVGCVEEQAGPAGPRRAASAGRLARAAAAVVRGRVRHAGDGGDRAGVPVVCSDLPALHEAGGGVPDFLDPLDGPAWERAIADLASDDSRIARAQHSRRVGPGARRPGTNISPSCSNCFIRSVQ